MIARWLALIVLIAAIAVLSVLYARPLLGLPAATPTAARSLPAATSAAAPSSTFILRPTPTPSASAAPARTPSRTATTSCPPVPAGGRQGAFHPLADVRVAHQPDFDRVVLDFGQEASVQDDVPAFRIERASTFTAVSGQPVAVQGSAFWSVRTEGASQADRQGTVVYKGSRDIVPTTPLVRNVKLVEDFEAVMIWAIGLAQLECPRVSTLRSPLRLVIDFSAPP